MDFSKNCHNSRGVVRNFVLAVIDAEVRSLGDAGPDLKWSAQVFDAKVLHTLHHEWRHLHAAFQTIPKLIFGVLLERRFGDQLIERHTQCTSNGA
jgi:hypothetical protein